MYKIDSNIPIPIKRIKYPWKNMKIGDSFYVPDCIGTKKFTSMRIAASFYGKKLGYKFTTAKWGTGIRIWRIE